MTYLRTNIFVVVGGYNFPSVATVEINRSIETLTNTAKITIQRKLSQKNTDIRELIKKGDTVEIWTGYGAERKQRFTGYVSKIGMNTPLVFECEDEAYTLKQSTFKTFFKSATVSDVLNYVLPFSMLTNVTADFNLGSFRINDATAADVLEELRSKYKLTIYFDESNVLQVGLRYDISNTKTTIVDLQQVKGHSLEAVEAAEQKVKIKGISVADDNTKIEYEEGESGGATKTYYYNALDMDGLKAAVRNELEKVKTDKLTGSVSLFGTPSVNLGQIVDLDDKINNYSGQYRVKSAVESWGVGIGGKQDVNLDIKIGE